MATIGKNEFMAITGDVLSDIEDKPWKPVPLKVIADQYKHQFRCELHGYREAVLKAKNKVIERIIGSYGI